ncbi:HlyD family efflux transporter periplasmic adaptor subunit [Sphingomonas sp. ABOLG]|jgi:HlyD family secretion protein|uniref:efflux RND transporter periplasmic adaptor subunit n=1 Tax=Sphingomonas sp. ABOLG TaxID=1985880 RepID=UPI000F7F6AF5|nr:efflux RND transporter periplasmic adaptor subunit [Sphingomonas sp. ABOLG]RSV17338.1 HlyD family efflux transporter periplasmic adaptor subunit [Sphingomonas sp. ABOLG]
MPGERRVVVVALGLVVAVAIAAWLLTRGGGDKPLTLYGNIDIREVDLSFRVEGKVADVLVDEGDAVRAGQVVAMLDAEPLRTDLAEAEATIAAQRSQLDLLRAGNRREDIAQAAAAVAERRAALANTQGDVDRLSSLRGTGAIADRRIEDAINQRDEAAARLHAAEQALAEQRAGTRPQEIAQAASNVDRARAAADRIRLRVNDTVLRAPSDGTILTRAVEKGANVAAGSTAFTEALARPVWARVFVDAPNLGLVAPGTIVRITTDAAPGKNYRGRIGYVSPTAEFTPKSVETEALRTALVYRARVVVLDPDARLRQGMPITVTLASGARAVED